jgi:uncharacterized membrane protein YqjE
MLQSDLATAQRRPPGLFESLSSLILTITQIARTRLELLGTEVEEQVTRLVSILVWSLVALFLAFATTILSAVAIIVAFWETHRLLAAIGVALVFGLAALLCGLRVVGQVKSRPRLFQATLGELKKDRERLLHHR